MKQHEDLGRLLCTVMFAAGMLFFGSTAQAAENGLVKCKVLSTETTEYSEYAKGYDKDCIEYNLRLYNPVDSRIDNMSVSITAPEGFSLSPDVQKSSAKYSVKPFTDKITLKIQLFPVGKISAPAEDKLVITAEDGERSSKFSIPVRTDYSSDFYSVKSEFSGSGKLEFLFSEKMFEKDTSEYDPELSKASLAMAISAFSSDSGEENWNKEIRRDKNIKAFMKELGFDDYASAKYSQVLSDSTNTAAYALSSRKITVGDEEKTLIAAAVRGGGYGAEWASNMNVGTGKQHQGFSESAKVIIDGIGEYIEKTGADPGNVIVWITGYSRGAAIAGTAAAELEKSCKVYAYTFACPANVKKSAAGESDVHNVLLASDLIPKLPLKGGKWGFVRYGTDIVYGKESASVKKVMKMLRSICPSAAVYNKYYETEMMAFAAGSNMKNDALVDRSSVGALSTMLFACYANAKTAGEEVGTVSPNINFFTGSISITADGENITADEIVEACETHYPNNYVDEIFGKE